MLNPKIWRQLGWILPLLAIAILVSRERQALRAATIEWSDFRRAGSIYFAPQLSERQRTSFRAALDSGRKRVAELYGPLRGTPTIIVADAQTLPRFTEVSTAVTHYQPQGATIVFGPAGQNVDVVAHELAHAELYARVGYTRIEWCVPTWLDEGLAVQFDNRAFYSSQEFERHVHEGWHLPPFQQMTSRAEFFAGGREHVRFHYAGARYAVGAWLQKKGRAEVVRFLETMSCGAPWRDELASISPDLE